MSTTSLASRPVGGWLRNETFDLTFIAGVAVMALVSGWAVVAAPVLFPFVLIADTWLLSQHHVVSTFTRLAFDSESAAKYRALLTWVPLVLLAGAVVLVAVFGTWALATTYFYAQWFHYMRQSYGVSQLYRRKADGSASDLIAKGVMYLFPVWGVLARSAQAPSTFLGLELAVLPTPAWAVQAASLAAWLALAVWAVRQAQAFARGASSIAYTLYVLSHVAVFVTGYIVIDDVNTGWLTVNIWHNAQYIMIVWLFNNNRFKDGVHTQHRFLSTLSQSNAAAPYLFVCLAIATIGAWTINNALQLGALAALPLVLVVNQTINFHHYVVDAVIWKVRKPALRRNLGVAS